MIRVGDKVVPYYNMVQVGVVIAIETIQSKILTTGGTSSGTRIASIMLDTPGKQVIKCKTEDLLHADK